MIHWLHELVWGPVLLCSLLTVGTYFSVRSGWFQILGLPKWWGQTVGSLFGNGKEKTIQDNPEVVSSEKVGRLQAACTALAATIGTGNIVGVATALTAGGPGAVFWMWMSALIGMMTAYAETYLGICYRRKLSDGRWFSGPCAYLLGGLHSAPLAFLYGILCLAASLGMGSMVQSNAISQTLTYTLDLPPLVCAVLVTLLVSVIIIGGVHRITEVTGSLIPLAAGVYTLFSALVLFVLRDRIPEVLAEIFRNALLPHSVFGGIGGYGISRAFRYGIARGVFSNEAGLGTLAGLHGATDDTTPGEQGMWAMFEVFFDTIFICTLTALVILCAAGGQAGLTSGGYDGAVLTGWCFGSVLGSLGEYLVSLAMVVFAFSTIIAWYFLGRQTLQAVLELMMDRVPKWSVGRESVKMWAERGYLCLYAYAVFLGCVCNLATVWELSDVLNGLMAFPNILALFLLRNKVKW